MQTVERYSQQDRAEATHAIQVIHMASAVLLANGWEMQAAHEVGVQSALAGGVYDGMGEGAKELVRWAFTNPTVAEHGREKALARMVVFMRGRYPDASPEEVEGYAEQAINTVLIAPEKYDALIEAHGR